MATTSNEPENAPPTIWRSLPYIQGISESVARRLKPYSVKIAHKPHSALRSNLVNVKDPAPTLQRRKIIYQIPCPGCDKTYTGQTGRLLGTRLRTSTRCQTARYKLVPRTALHGHRPHLQLAGHPYAWICQLPKGKRSDRSLHSGEHSVNQFMQLDQCFRSMHL